MVESLEREMELLCLTGVEDQLQADVRPTLEMLRNAGIKVQCIASHSPHGFLLSKILFLFELLFYDTPEGGG